MLAQEDLQLFLAQGHEVRGVEFKGPGFLTDTPLFLKTAKAILALSNHSGGGYVILGVRDRSSSIEVVGLDDRQVASWSSHDDLTSALREYCDPPVEVSTQIMNATESATLVVLQVYEFEMIPTLCNKDASNGNVEILRQGACYVRRRGKPETTEFASQAEMRDLIDLATRKGVRKWVETMDYAGLRPDSSEDQASKDSQLFDDQLSDLKQ